MIDPTKYKPANLLPHGAPMVLIDEVVEWNQGHAAAAVYINEKTRFYVENKGVPAHVGLEYMAQTCGVYSGLFFVANNQPVHMGFLLGTRNFQCKNEYFAPGEKLIIRISEALRQGPMGVFNCRISVNDNEIASAQLTVYQSDDTASTV